MAESTMAKRQAGRTPGGGDGEAEAKPVIGWREWVTLPDLRAATVKAKVDTGARSSTLHAYDIRTFRKGGEPWVRFEVHPLQRTREGAVEVTARLLEWRWVRNSGGERTWRPVIETDVELLGQRWPIELTLVNRDEMGFRMLLGRQAVRRRFLIDPGRSYRGGPGPTVRRRKKKRKKKGGRKSRDAPARRGK